MAERVIRQLQEWAPWCERFATVEEANAAVRAFCWRFREEMDRRATGHPRGLGRTLRSSRALRHDQYGSVPKEPGAAHWESSSDEARRYSAPPTPVVRLTRVPYLRPL